MRNVTNDYYFVFKYRKSTVYKYNLIKQSGKVE